jgi:hypothetical protein
MTMLFISAAAALGGVFAAAGGAHCESRSPTLIAGTAMGAGVLALVSLWSALSRGRSMLGRPRAIVLAIAVAAPVALFVWKVGWSAQYPDALDAWPVRVGFRCLGLTLAMSLWPLFALALARRGTDPVHPAVTGAAFGVAVGACAWVLTDLWCPIAYPPHLLLGHVLPIALLAGLGAYLGKRFIAISAR